MADKYRINEKRTVAVGAQKFPGGSAVTPEKLGVTKKEFDKLIEDGTIVVEKDTRKSAQQKQSDSDNSGGD